MTSHESRVTCLCARGGDGDVWDHLLHYLGCLQFRDRDNFFEDTNIFWEQEIQHQVQLGSDPLDAIKAVLDDRESWKIDCERELRRIDSLRKTLAADKTESHLVERLEESRLQWRKSEAYITGIDRARMSREESNTRDILPPIVDSRDYGPYEPEKDLNVDILQLENGKGTNVEDGRVRGTFPNQRTTIAKLLADINLEASLLHGDQRPGSIRYLHIPANNREWVEEIINRYLENKSSQNRHNHKSEIPEDTKGHTTLRESYWGDQLYDPRDVETPPIARHIRPSCTMVSASTDGAESSPENLTLFMPYLYWETSRKQNQFAAEIDYIMAEAEMRNSRLGVEDRVKPVKEGKMAYNSSLELDAVRSSNGQKGRTRKNLSWLRRVSNWTNKYNPIMLPRAKTPMIKPSWTNSLAKGSNSGKIRRQVNEEGHIQVRNPLGRYLLFASRLYESMENYRDKMLLRKHLLQELPIHPRRTLDHAARSVFDLNRQRDETQGLRPEHESSETLPTSQNIQKAPFVVMVDQLWMWILDENTIITCFPNQYGSNEDDESGVHKSIRIRLKNCGPDQIRSVFDLALIVIDECCNKLFDKITESKQTLKVDTIFADRIEVVVLKLVKWKRYRDVTGLDTSPKRKLEEELNDIVRKLQVILHIIENQKDILRKFVSNAEHMLNPIKISEQNKDGTTSRNLLELSRVDNGEHENGSKDTKREGDYYWFKKNADELYTKLDQRVKELETLRRRALRTAEYIKAFESLHTVKQQLINSDRKARPITICLVIVTIFFLPLSFLSAFFGMNNAYMPIKRSHDQDRPRLMSMSLVAESHFPP
ncbi:hypothetical protein F4860DRAFT_462002 [Xylaria cubensis]|nr:hypothetical protein F4860DRAFT_462002 [Xylaria cubensis]